MLERDELIEHLEDLQRFLSGSATRYDSGDLAEAKNMALHARVLFHQTEQSHALLSQLGLLEGLSMACTNAEAVDPRATHVFGGFGIFTFEGYLPDLSAPNRWEPFPQWWREVLVRSSQIGITRRSVVLSLANKGGGGHVDHRPNNEYRKIQKLDALGVVVVTDGGADHSPELNRPLAPFMRTITHEILISLDSVKF